MAGAFPRRFTLADAMILVAAAGAGLAGARWWYRQPGFVNPSSLDVQSSTELVAWALMPFIPALAMIRLKGPRPRRRKLLRESGFQAITASGLGVVAALLTGRWGIRPGWSSLGYGIGSGAPDMVGPAVAISWLLTGLAGARRSRPGAIDRSGRALGWLWIAVWASRCALLPDSLIRMWIG